MLTSETSKQKTENRKQITEVCILQFAIVVLDTFPPNPIDEWLSFLIFRKKAYLWTNVMCTPIPYCSDIDLFFFCLVCLSLLLSPSHFLPRLI